MRRPRSGEGMVQRSPGRPGLPWVLSFVLVMEATGLQAAVLRAGSEGPRHRRTVQGGTHYDQEPPMADDVDNAAWCVVLSGA